MKITFSNLGSIKKTTLDLRPLTVIIGPNNSNKTYIAYSIYGLLNGIAITAMAPLVFGLGYKVGDGNLSNDIQKIYQIDSNGSYLLKIDDFLRILLEDTSQLTQNFEQNLKEFFQDTSGKLFKKTKFEIKLSLEELRDAFNKLVSSKDFANSEKITYTLDENLFLAKIKEDFDYFEKVPLQHFVASSILFELKSFLYPQAFLLPAERNALIISYKILENRRYELLKNANRNRFVQQNLTQKYQRNLFETLKDVPFQEDVRYLQPSINYPQPIEDFLRFLTNLELENPLEKGNFAEFAEDIEKNLQKGDKTNYISREVGGREIKINIEKDLDIDLYNASSSIKQLAPLLLYLRYRAKENDLLIIDEPEMNLHPESQAKFLEILGMLVNAGINVLLTTHSPYFMSHLNNLVSGKTDDEKTLKEQAKSLYLKDERAFLSMDDVSAYEMKNNKLKDLKDKDYGIRWDTLSDVSADIQQKYFEIYEKSKETSDGEEEN